ncbi:hypothetical protein GCM10023257_12170 [Streptomyces hyderabadensis]|uniref:Transposase n=1 Tax=Streptomyces hyderabadensis TaxID=598549 RepID=A0ABP9HRQ3_9ACTN
MLHTELVCGGFHGLREQDGKGHRPNATGNRSDQTSSGAGGVVVHVSDVARVEPASITTAPGLMSSPRISRGRPTAATTTSASRTIADRAAKEVLLRLRLMHPEITIVRAGSAYAGQLVDWAKTFLGLTIKTVSRPKNVLGFVVLPRSWVVECSGNIETDVLLLRIPGRAAGQHSRSLPSSTRPTRSVRRVCSVRK